MCSSVYRNTFALLKPSIGFAIKHTPQNIMVVVYLCVLHIVSPYQLSTDAVCAPNGIVPHLMCAFTRDFGLFVVLLVCYIYLYAVRYVFCFLFRYVFAGFAVYCVAWLWHSNA